MPRGYALRGALPIRRLDGVLHRDTEVQVRRRGRVQVGRRGARLEDGCCNGQYRSAYTKKVECFTRICKPRIPSPSRCIRYLGISASPSQPTHPQVLKVDVEGYEPHVLSGAAGLYRVWYVAAEYNPVLLRGVNAEGAGPEGYRPGKVGRGRGAGPEGCRPGKVGPWAGGCAARDPVCWWLGRSTNGHRYHVGTPALTGPYAPARSQIGADHKRMTPSIVLFRQLTLGKHERNGKGLGMVRCNAQLAWLCQHTRRYDCIPGHTLDAGA